MDSLVIKIFVPVVLLIVVVFGFRAWLSAHDKSIVEEQKGVCAADKAGMVSQASYAALQASIAKRNADAEAARQAALRAQERARSAELAAEEANKRLAALEKSAESKKLPTWTDEELKWLRDN